MKASRRQKEPMETKYKVYWAVGIIIAVLVIALLVWNSKITTKSATAVTVAGENYSVAEFSYYYKAAANSTISFAAQYADYGIDTGYDLSLSPSEQYYDEDNGVTYADYFMQSAVDNLQNVTILCKEAKAEGFTISEEGQAQIDSNMNALKMYSLQSGYSEDAYLHLLYGNFMSMSLFKDVLHDAVLASEYANYKAEQYEVTDAEMQAYYEENKDSMDSFTYRSCYINYEVAEQTDEDGNVIEASEEEVAAAMAVASEKANQMIAEINEGSSFNAAAAKYVDEDSAANYSDDSFGLIEGIQGASLNTTIEEWMVDPARVSGDITSIEAEGIGCCVVQFLGREKGDNIYQTRDYSTILVLAETTENPDDGTSLPTEEQLAAAREQADTMLGQVTGLDSFAALAEENGAENGGLVEAANRSAVSVNVADWLFADTTSEGDTTVVEYTDANGNVTGYEVLYAGAPVELRWKYQARTALQSNAYEAWYDAQVDANPAEVHDAAKAVIDL